MENKPQQKISNKTKEERHYAGFWIRVLALFIDFIALSILGLLFGASSIGPFELAFAYTGWKVVVPITYFIGFWIWKSATPGKIILGLKIIDEKGLNINVSQAVIRFFSLIISAIPFLLGFFWIGFHPKKRTWHDMIAKTFVIKNK
ncbi:MAG: RDD family protein [Candidatus Magasanikbacteria bacterium CG_4_10_14_0_2_um_filter_33_14]|uniref:RDD family protein n=1 Tax=Candidatus Magasanikbacteria bacterium CG_4_10_14_0_2_um_filter_33_14 TaxID=1974636 RepID=A0A2M7VAC8_9BACT|nr:MAG: RDD family protein [Candidatus Magasanikbacteria bacterium CG_4_10_14_0_2_um_filter_33_14]